MYPDDRVLIAYVPKPSDFALIQEQGWYRIPYRSAPKGLHAEWFAFYFGSAFGPQKWSVSAYAPRLGHELVQRRELLPSQSDHPRADDWYYQIQLGAISYLKRPIISLQWRRITFLHTTWDRFQEAVEINDLFLDGDTFVDREFSILKDGRSHRTYPSSNHNDRLEITSLFTDGQVT
ncbi:MAG: hypothetical protein CSB13_03890 [Chloroflexi bacterium]|nr:MAG: hypothetical protein CSB13_03890 [Chloroflexota bacterium]